MTISHTAQGLASLGRNGDSMLVHMSPEEVGGLQQIGNSLGIKMSTNPHTGLPEAFDFGDFFTSLIPTGIGMLLGGPAGAAMGLKQGTLMASAAPVLGGMAAGAAVAGAKGDDPLMGGLMGGLGGYGGGNLANSLGKMGAQGGYAAGQTLPAGQAITTPAGMDALNATNPLLGAPGTVNPSLTNLASTGANAATPMTYSQGLGQMGRGATELLSPGGYDKFVSPEIGGSAMQLVSPLAFAGFEGVKKDLYPEPDTSLEEKRKAEENKYRDEKTGLLNLAQASPDFGTKFLATGGTVGANQSTIASGGIQDLYGTNDQSSATPSLSRDGYGIGRLNELAAQGSRAKAADTFYAMGGPIAFAKGGHQGYLDGEGDGMSDSIPATIEGKQPARLADGEFVIPADVVSHIGNGSSKAGSKQLYAMLDRVRKARVGHTKQGKEIKPRKYMPA